MIVYWHFNHIDTPICKHVKRSHIWPEPQILEAAGSKIHLVNTSNEPKAIGRHEHLSQILPTIGTVTFRQPYTHRSTVSCVAQVFTTLFVCCVRQSGPLTTRSVPPPISTELQRNGCSRRTKPLQYLEPEDRISSVPSPWRPISPPF